MEKWSREEIEKQLSIFWFAYETNPAFAAAHDIISHLLQQLDEAEKRVARECAGIAINESKYDRLSGWKSSENIAAAIRKKYIGG